MSRSAVGMHVVKLAMPMRAACGHKQGATARIQALLGQARAHLLRDRRDLGAGPVRFQRQEHIRRNEWAGEWCDSSEGISG